MKQLKIQKVLALPETLDTDTLYLLKNSEGDLELYTSFTSSEQTIKIPNKVEIINEVVIVSDTEPALPNTSPIWVNKTTGTLCVQQNVEGVDAWVPITDEGVVSFENIQNLPTTRDGFGITDVPKSDGTDATGTWNISISGNADTASMASEADTLVTPRTVNGTSFDGSANITTGFWGMARNLTIGSMAKSVNGSQNVSWTLTEIGAPGLDGTGAIGTWSISINGNADTASSALTADKLTTARTITLSGDISGTATFDGSSDANITVTVSDDSHNHSISTITGLQTALDGKLASGATAVAATKIVATAETGTTAELIRATMGGSDKFRILVGGATADAGYAEIAVCDNGTEPIYVRQYSGSQEFTTLVRSLTLLDESGNSSFPGTLTGTSFNSITGLSSTTPIVNGTAAVGTSTTAARSDHVHPTDTTRASVSQTMYIGTTAFTINRTSGSQALTGITSIDGLAATATKLATARTISLTGDVTGSVSFDGSANASIAATVADDSHNHSISTVTGLSTALASKADLVDGVIPASQLPSYVDDVLEYASLASFPVTGESGKIYIDTSAPRSYRWSGTVYVDISPTGGNADTATKLATARTITLAGDVTGSVSFDGSANVSISTTVAANSVALGTDTTGNYVATVAVSGTGLSVSGSGAESAAVTVTSNATNANTASTIVARDASGNFSAGTITATLSGNATTATTASACSGNSATATSAAACTGNAATATVLQTARTINGTSFDGSAAITTANWGTARTITIGSTGKSVNGSANVSWTLAELGAAPTASPTFTGVTSVVAANGTHVALASGAINLAAGSSFSYTLIANTTFTLSNVPASGKMICFILELTNAGAYTTTLWSNIKWAGGTVPTLTASGRDVLGFYTRDGGTTWTGTVIAKDAK